MKTVLPRASFWLLISTALLAPLPFGSVYQWSWAGMAALVGVAAMLYSISVAIGQKAVAAPGRYVWSALALFAAVVLWIYLQTVPWTPQSWHHPLWNRVPTATGLDVPGAVSIMPDDGMSAILRLLAYGIAFWLGCQFATRSDRVRSALMAITVAATIYTAYGLVAQFLLPGSLGWIKATGVGKHVTGTFINRNIYASYAGMTLLCGLALITREALLLTGRVGAREAVRLAVTQFSGRLALLVVAGTILSCGLLLSVSRAGIASTLIAGLVFVLALAFARAVRPRVVLVLVAALLFWGAVVFLAAGLPFADRVLGAGVTLEIRGEIYATTWEAILDHPLLGTGAGSFPDVYPAYQLKEYWGNVGYAHNAYLETALELGIPATAALLAAALLTVSAMVGALRCRSVNPVYPALGLAELTLVAVHGVVDFALIVPAVALTFALILGLSAGSGFKAIAVTRRAADGRGRP